MTRKEILRVVSVLSCVAATACVGQVEDGRSVGQWPQQTGEHDGGTTFVPNPGFNENDSGSPLTPAPPNPDPGTGDGDENPGTGDGDENPGTGDGDGPVADGCDAPEEERYARDVRIAEVSLYQSVKVPLFSAGSAVTTRSAPVVQGKTSLVRVFVRPEGSFATRNLRAVLTLKTGSNVKRFTQDLMVRSESTDASLPTTFNFNLEGAEIQSATEWTAAVVETSCAAPRGTSAAARAPASGSVALNAEIVHPIELVLVPTTINGITSAPTQAQVDSMRAALLAYYPVPDVRVRVRAAHDISKAWNCASDSWSCALDEILSLRSADGVNSSTYYYGLLNPARTFTEYCRSSCVLGIAYGVSAVSARYQGAVGIGFDVQNTNETLIHEIAHAHGRSHAPCAPGNSLAQNSIDRSYPYPDARIGDWGWDSRSGALVPATHKDVMSYCNPTWISAYNYSALAQRAKIVNKMAFVLDNSQAEAKATQGVQHRNLIVSAEGLTHWGALVEYAPAPGEAQEAEVLDAASSLIDTVTVYRGVLADSGSEFVFVPALPSEATSLRLFDRTLELPVSP